MRFLFCFLLALALALAPAAHAQAQGPAQAPSQSPASPITCSFHGRIADPLGAAIDRAFVLVYSARREKIDRQAALSKNGEFSLQLEPGLYDLFVASPGFVPLAKIVDLRSCKPVELKVKMRVDIEHLED
jgi:hypothetical protein